MSGPLGSQQWMYSAAADEFYTHQIANSVRVSNDDGDSTATNYLHLNATAGNSDVWTIGMWIKRARVATSDANTAMAAWGGHSGSGSARGYGMVSDYTGTISGMSFENNNGSSWHITTRTSAMYRDTSAWTHVCWRYDSSQSTDTNRARMYVNGVVITDLNNTTYGAQNADHSWNGGGEQFIGCNGTATDGNNPYQGFDGYIAEVVSIDGTSLDPMDNLVELKNGVLIPKDPSGLTFGDEGFYLKFENSAALGNDSSGNDNDFSVVGIAAHDQTTDSPTFNSSSNGGNFCTINSIFRGTSTTAANYGILSEGNLKLTYNSTSDAYQCCTHKVPASGKWYWEYAIIGGGGSASYNPGFGIFDPNGEAWGGSDGGNKGFVDSIVYDNGSNKVFKARSETKAYDGSRGSDADVMGIAIDMDNGAFYVSKNGTFYSSGDPTSGASRTNAGATWAPASEYTAGAVPLACCGGGSAPIIVANFGQEGTFAGTETAGNNADGNGFGNFFSSVPSGYSAICSGALTVAAAIDPGQTDDNYPQKLFAPKLYTGDGATTLAITGMDFQPDFSWIKNRDTTDEHLLFDSTRGVTKYISTEDNGAEATDADTLKSWTSDGFTVGADVKTNTNTEKYVSWNWRVNGGTTSTNDEGSIDTTVQVDPSGAFSIVNYTGATSTWDSMSTIGHGLSSAPDCIIQKGRFTINWELFFSDYGKTSGNGSTVAGNSMTIETTAALYSNQTYRTWGNVMPTADVITINGNNANNPDSAGAIAYCFANTEGYIKQGAYEGNGNADGTFVYTGFKPAFIMTKSVDSTSSWHIFDNLREGYNKDNDALIAEDTTAEATADMIDILSNGFKFRIATDPNVAEGYIYLALAHNPFKYATAG
tara:strand:+ start:37 stop:2661 length:2625 start_codon:yes stop_codon:yes gene_type:complete